MIFWYFGIVLLGRLRWLVEFSRLVGRCGCLFGRGIEEVRVRGFCG